MSATNIARGLSKAQRKALCGLPIQRDFTPKHTGYQWPSLSVLKSKRLINGVRDGIMGMGKDALHRVTPLGREVRQAIIDAAEAEAGANDPTWSMM